MACVPSLNLCTTCQTLDNEQKSKPGILLCMGCHKNFCSKHMMEHREYLNDLVETEVICERNSLKEKFSIFYEERWSATLNIQLETINNWERDAIEQIKLSTACTREQLADTTLKQYQYLQMKFSILSNELNTLRENESYLENDIDQLKTKFQELNSELEQYPVEISFNKIPNDSILIKSITQAQCPVVPSHSFIDRVLTSTKPKISIDVSRKNLEQMHPMSKKLITFSSSDQLPALNIADLSWHSLHPIKDVIELQWCDQLQLFLVLKSGDYCGDPRRLFHYHPFSGRYKKLFTYDDEVTTFTCFQNHILIVRDKTIESWVVADRDWHLNEDKERHSCWSTPISCHSDTKIISIRMNSEYYALIMRNNNDKSCYLELRNHVMFTLHCIEINEYDFTKHMRLFSLPEESGWLFFLSKKQAAYCCVFDNNGKQHNQNIVLASNILDIAIYNNLIFVRKVTGKNDNEVVEVYDW